MTFRRLCILPFLALSACQPATDTIWQGWIEADLLFIGPEDSGRIVETTHVEGDQVQAGDPLFSIDATVQRADAAAAQGALAQARARLARLEAAQQRPEEVAVIEAAQQQARAALDFSTSELERIRPLVGRGIATRQQLDQAQSNYDRDRAAVDNAARQIDVARMGGRTEDIDAARGAADQAGGQAASALARLARSKVVAPATGRIEEIYYRAGEVVPPGKPVLSLLPPGNLKARFFVPETALSRIQIDQKVALSCDGCQQGLTARISFISHQSEFTPPVIFSLEERRKLVFKVEARLDKPELFRVGQPVSVTAAGSP